MDKYHLYDTTDLCFAQYRPWNLTKEAEKFLSRTWATFCFCNRTETKVTFFGKLDDVLLYVNELHSYGVDADIMLLGDEATEEAMK